VAAGVVDAERVAVAVLDRGDGRVGRLQLDIVVPVGRGDRDGEGAGPGFVGAAVDGQVADAGEQCGGRLDVVRGSLRRQVAVVDYDGQAGCLEGGERVARGARRGVRGRRGAWSGPA
jgi:hypothetical protein